MSKNDSFIIRFIKKLITIFERIIITNEFVNTNKNE